MPRISTPRQRDPDTGQESDFKAVYEEPGVRYLGLGGAMGLATLIAFFAIAIWEGKLVVDSIGQQLRLLGMAGMGALVYLTVRHRRFVVRKYSLVTNITIITTSMLGVAISYLGHVNDTPLQAIYSMDMTMVIIIVVVFGFCRCKAANVATLCAVTSITAVIISYKVYGFRIVPPVTALAVHLTIVNICAYFLRANIESRERQLFIIGIENLRRNVYAKELEVAKQAAEEADAAKSKFLANMSHEIRTPMNGVLQILELLRKEASESQSTLIDIGSKAGYALLRILNNILDYTKLDQSSTIELRPSKVNLTELIQTVVDLHQSAAVIRGIELRTRIDVSRSVAVEVDEVKLFEVISNLVSNAIKFTDQGYVALEISLAELETQAQSGTLEIVVRDSGHGISIDQRDKVFLPFYQIEGPRQFASSGTGLGLAIVKELVGLLKGNIQLTGAVDQGSIFTVHIPVHLTFETLKGPGFLSNQNNTPGVPIRFHELLNGKRLLLVEDNQLNIALALAMLKPHGLEIVVAENGKEAVEEYKSSQFDLVLMDCQMPLMDGYEATRQIRSYDLSTRRRTPIIAVTANTLTGSRELCLSAGMDDYLSKPYSSDSLSALLVKWTEIDKSKVSVSMNALRIHADN